MRHNLKILTFNCRGLNNPTKRRNLFFYLRKYRFDIICLQETHINKNNYHEWQKQWAGPLQYSLGSASSQGLVILFSKQFTNVDIQVVHKEDRILCVTLETGEVKVGVCNVYGPNNDSEKKAFFQHLQDVISDNYVTLEKFCVVGDFNTVLDNDKRHNRRQPALPDVGSELPTTYNPNEYV